MKTVALYSPYIPKHAGGGERFMLSIAQVASWSTQTSLLVLPSQVEATQSKLKVYASMFGLDLSRVSVEGSDFGKGGNPLTTLQASRKYDVFFAMTDGSIPPILAKKAYLIMQVPWTRHLSLPESLKLRMWTKVLVYSPFVRDVLSRSWSSKIIDVCSPYVDTRDFQAVSVKQKEKLIVNVGRFFSHTQSNSKRQDVLIEAFSKMLSKYRMKGWHLALLGNVDPNADSQTFVRTLKESARGYPVTFHTDISYDELRAFYARASIYWHAAGYQVDQAKHPENTEHFGITTLEAMASGCIPFVVPNGGQREIVADDRFFWNDTEELAMKTASLINSIEGRSNQWQSLSTKMVEMTQPYTKSVFEQNIEKLL